MKTNEELQKDVQDAIKWEPLLHAAKIGVIAIDGVITLTGTVDSYAKKLEAEDATKNVAGVRAVVEKIEVKYDIIRGNIDNEIAKDILYALTLNKDIPEDKIIIKVEDGWVTLEGELPRNYQREAVKKTIHTIFGINAVTNNISIRSETEDSIEKRDIELALRRNWSIEDRLIQVDVTGNTVTLKGIIQSLYQKTEAGRIAWNAPGVWAVRNELVIECDLL